MSFYRLNPTLCTVKSNSLHESLSPVPPADGGDNSGAGFRQDDYYSDGCGFKLQPDGAFRGAGKLQTSSQTTGKQVICRSLHTFALLLLF